MKNLAKLMIVTAIFIFGIVLGLSLSPRLNNQNEMLEQAVRLGRLNTPQGVYYLTPVPAPEEIAQMKNDIDWLNKQLNKKRRRS
jgi:hypothetical protein